MSIVFRVVDVAVSIAIVTKGDPFQQIQSQSSEMKIDGL
jgi:hypothetical protein